MKIQNNIHKTSGDLKNQNVQKIKNKKNKKNKISFFI